MNPVLDDLIELVEIQRRRRAGQATANTGMQCVTDATKEEIAKAFRGLSRITVTIKGAA